MKRSDSSEFKKRINFIYGLLLQGFQRKRIIQIASEKYDVSERQLDKYIQIARKIFHKDQQIDIDIKRSEIISQYYHLYQQSYDLEDYKECKSILNEIANLVGVKHPKLLDITTNGKDFNINEIYGSKDKEA